MFHFDYQKNLTVFVNSTPWDRVDSKKRWRSRDCSFFGANPSTEFVAALFLEISRKMCIIDGRKHFFCIFHVAAYQKHRGQTYVHFSKKQKIFRNFVFCAFYTKNSQVLSFEKGGFTLEFQADERCNVGANVQFQWTFKRLESSPEVDLVDF